MTDDPLARCLAEIKRVAVVYRRLTGKPLGVTGELAELAAARVLGLTLCGAREAGFDARDQDGKRVQIKGRAVDAQNRYRGRCPAILCGDRFDYALLVLLDRDTFEPLEIHAAEEDTIEKFLQATPSKARRERGQMGIRQFRMIGRPMWTAPA